MNYPKTTELQQKLAQSISDMELLRGLNGAYVGQLDKEELAAFERLVVARKAQREYIGMAGMLGMARVRIWEDREKEGWKWEFP